LTDQAHAEEAGHSLTAILAVLRFFGLTGLWLAFPIADVLGLVLGQAWMNLELRKQGIRFLQRKAQPLAEERV
jgi:hypothetical protein